MPYSVPFMHAMRRAGEHKVLRVGIKKCCKKSLAIWPKRKSKKWTHGITTPVAEFHGVRFVSSDPQDPSSPPILYILTKCVVSYTLRFAYILWYSIQKIPCKMPAKRRAGKNKEATVEEAMDALEKTKINARTATGEWATTPKSRDIHVC